MVNKFSKNQSGATAIETAVFAAFVILAVSALFSDLADSYVASFSDVTTALGCAGDLTCVRKGD